MESQPSLQGFPLVACNKRWGSTEYMCSMEQIKGEGCEEEQGPNSDLLFEQETPSLRVADTTRCRRSRTAIQWSCRSESFLSNASLPLWRSARRRERPFIHCDEIGFFWGLQILSAEFPIPALTKQSVCFPN